MIENWIKNIILKMNAKLTENIKAISILCPLDIVQ